MIYGRLKDIKNIMLSKITQRLGLFLFASLLLISVMLCYFLYALKPVASKDVASEVEVTISPHVTARQVAALLQEKGLIRNPAVFILYARWRNQDSLIKAGTYRLSNNLTAPEILEELVWGRLGVELITIPEGFNTAQVAELLDTMGLIKKELFYAGVAEGDYSYYFIQGLAKDVRRMEGYLFPDTYQVVRGTSENIIIDMMLRRFEKEISDLDYENKARGLGLTLHEAVTMASMIEREAMVEEERYVISGVIHNRINKSMLLQIDATVQYALGTNKPKLYYKDLEIESPYNTYIHHGLPPGPIAMPGRASLLAAVYPARTPYLYYVAKPDGSHAFATTLEDHINNKKRYQ